MQAMEKVRDKYFSNMKGCSVLDVGSRRIRKPHDTYRSLFEPDYEYVGMDIVRGKNVDVVGYEALNNRRFDILISGQVMEHVNHPWEWLRMLRYYFKDYICIIAPSHADEHRHPIDTYRYFPDGMRDLFNYAEIEEVEIYGWKHNTIGIGTHKREAFK
jgi:hypothetical protein